MKRHIYTQIDYNLWANLKIVELLQSQHQDILEQAVDNSFPSIKATLAHMHYAESLWLQRIRLDKAEQIQWQHQAYSNTELCNELIHASTSLKTYTDKADEMELGRTVAFISGEGVSLTNTVERILYHVVNHSSYHRGQIITMLKQLGVKQAISTDLYYYYQEL